MFEIRSLILIVFMLVLRVFPKLSPDTIYKSFEVAKIFVKKSLKFVLGNKNICIYLKYMLIIILSSVSTNTVPKKKNRKQDVFIVDGYKCITIVFILLIKLIAI